jgi:hypothetical protein
MEKTLLQVVMGEDLKSVVANGTYQGVFMTGGES